MSVPDQLALDLPGVAAPPPSVLEAFSDHDRAVVLGVLTRLIVKTIAAELVSARRSPVSEYPKVAATHLRRAAVVYVRQSSASQLDRNRESTDRQYALAERAVSLGWPREAVRVIDADLGVSGAQGSPRSGFTELTSLVALGQVGIVLALEVSRLARSQQRLVPAAGFGRADRHAAGRHRRCLPPRAVQ